jgi:hypothetical protein
MAYNFGGYDLLAESRTRVIFLKKKRITDSKCAYIHQNHTFHLLTLNSLWKDPCMRYFMTTGRVTTWRLRHISENSWTSLLLPPLASCWCWVDMIEILSALNQEVVGNVVCSSLAQEHNEGREEKRKEGRVDVTQYRRVGVTRWRWWLKKRFIKIHS